VPNLRLPVLPDAYTYSYPKEADKAPTIQYFPLDTILTRAWTMDVHTTAYSVEHHPYRLSRDAVQFDGGVVMVLFLADVDGPTHLASDDWWLNELVKLDALRQAFPGAFIYRTRGGYRVLYRLPEPHILQSAADVAQWKADYLAWVAALHERFAIEADPACQDWQRLYRLPHATRSGRRPEAREILGSPYQIGKWTCEPTPDERERAKTLARRPSKREPREHQRETHHRISDRNGVLYYAFKARDWLGDALDSEKWIVRCPWDHLHTKGTTFNTSTVLFAPGPGDMFGWLHCSHAHCQQYDIRDVLKVLTEDELARAKQQAGIITPTAKPRRHVRLYKPNFGLRVKGVRHAS
jgi:hypothetical protein